MINESQVEQRRALGCFLRFDLCLFDWRDVVVFADSTTKAVERLFFCCKEHTAVVRVHGVITEDGETSAMPL